MERNIVNCTPHEVVVMDESRNVIATFPASGINIRLKTTTERVGDVNGIPLTKTVFGEPEGLPSESEDTLLIVSQLVKNACPHRKDLVVPAEPVRDEQGRVIGCLSLGM